MNALHRFRRTPHCFGVVGVVALTAACAGCSAGSSIVSSNVCATDSDCPSGLGCSTIRGVGVCQSRSGGQDTSNGRGGAIGVSDSPAMGGGGAVSSGKGGGAGGGEASGSGKGGGAGGGEASGSGKGGGAGGGEASGKGGGAGGGEASGSGKGGGAGGGEASGKGGSAGGAVSSGKGGGEASGRGGADRGGVGGSGGSAKGGSRDVSGGGGASGGTREVGAGGTKSGGAGSTSSTSTGSSASCAGYPVWNSKVTYNTAGQLVEYNCNLYKNQGFAFDVNPETNHGQYYQWLLMGACSESDCARGEGPWVACGNYDHWTSGPYEVYNDVWGGGAGSQCIKAWDGSHWTVQSTQPATSGVKSYPNSGIVKVGKTIGSLSKFTSSFEITVPTGGDWEAAYDIWVPTEIMIWMYAVGNVGPIATSWDSDGKPVPSATDVTVGGHTWNVYHQNGGNNVISFVRTTNTTAGTVDILALLNWAREQGWIPDGTIGAAQFGFEISGTNDQATDFTCNSFSMTAN